MKRRKIASILLVGAMVGSMLVGCGQKGDDAKAESGSDGKEVLTVMCPGTASDTYRETYQEIADDFSKDNEFGVEVKYEFYEREQFKTKLTTLMASNSVPDIFFTWELDYLKPFVDGGKVYELTGELDGDTEWKDSFIEGTLDPLTYDGKVYAIPTQSTLATMYYNKQIFEDNGVEVPETYEEFLEVCETLKNNDVTPMTLAATTAWVPAEFVQQLADGIGGMDLYNGIVDGSKKWNDEAHIEAGKEVQNMIDKGYFQDGMLGMSEDEAKALFQQGKAAMYYMGAWEVSTFINEETTPVSSDIGVFNMPAKNPENDGIIVGSVDSSYAIAETCKNKEAAIAFLKYYTSVPAQEKLVYDQGRLPSIKMEFDESKLKPLVIDVMEVSKNAKGMTPWWDRVFGAGEGVEFNNQSLAIFGGDDVQTAFDDLESFAENNADR
ncbi:raffinose/stachyose/melibiose transport system substrate-binding protein [Aequitasia blattaphilus]|uniref:Extracellular solute-binding protein n=1 Tax=Aequitasia blattaphilus TaxID=2949332 RepID=A0ABT1EAX5_9FIRM|nr:extracellular solute-binding protein [Aequitasia blattaphilus]MCP1102989.1 extracellular solute-binding protein [Aequitasia blattaphilus]MCR8615629.1 extracellular solute-binding protein [Aequitasia blattaphilus]